MAVFEGHEVEQVLSLHDKAYQLFAWVRDGVAAGRVSFSVVHTRSDSASAAVEWISRHRESIPSDARPDEDLIEPFANIFVSFLKTSYELKENVLRAASWHGCRCDYCIFLQAGPMLQLRMPSKRHTETADELKRILLSRVASANGLQLSADLEQGLLCNEELSADIALTTWVAELMRRAKFASQGEAVLLLWRQFAWKDGKMKKKIRLNAQVVINAETRIVVAIGRASHAE